MIFFLGIHMPNWMEETDVPLFVSRNRFLSRCKRRLPRALGPWSLDSGAFTEISTHGHWTFTPQRYAIDVRRFMAEVGRMEWAAIMDWMCEPWILKKTGLSVEQHQLRTIRSLATLRWIAPDVPWAPVLQGWKPADYLRHREMYEIHGFDLSKEKIVGVGSVCRRGHTDEIQELARGLSDLKLHGFGVKTKAINKLDAAHFHSTDSMAWSFRARHREKLNGCEHPGTCANCLRFALWWRRGLLKKLEQRRRERETLCAA